MRSAHRCIAASLVAGLLLTGPAARAQEALAVPPDEPVAGRTQAQWSQAWWQWAASFDRAESPVADRTGRLCDRKQGGEVWFLAGTYGTRRTVRTCTVPAGRFLFFPLVNYIVMPSLREPITCDEARTRAAELTHGAGALVVDVDGERVTGAPRPPPGDGRVLRPRRAERDRRAHLPVRRERLLRDAAPAAAGRACAQLRRRPAGHRAGGDVHVAGGVMARLPMDSEWTRAHTRAG